MRLKKKKNKNIRTRKAPFYVLAEKLMENLRILNEVKECPDCKTLIEENMKICPKCGNEFKDRLTYEENMEYIRGYIQDKIYTQNEIIHELDNKLTKYEKIIEENELLDLFGLKKQLEPIHNTKWKEFSIWEFPRGRPPSFSTKTLIDKINQQQSIINKFKELIKIIRANNLEEFFLDIPEVHLPR
ncbi:MAG: hypothetical protein ACFE91_07520 [Promethearchaeota archaeon]